MFPSPIGAAIAEAVRSGVDPKAVIPDNFVIVHGGAGATAPLGKVFSGVAGKGLEEAAAAVPHGTIRVTTAGAIRAKGGVVEWAPEISRHQTINQQHVNITESGSSSFSELQPNPVPRTQRIDGRKK